MKKQFLLFGACCFLAATLIYFNSSNPEPDDPPRSNEVLQSIRDAQSYHNLLRRNALTGTVNPADFIKGRKEVMASMNKQEKSVGLTWLEMGPDNFGGRTRAILSLPVPNHNEMYAGGVSGGLWHSTNGGDYWTRVEGFNGSLMISDIDRTSNGHIYVATGNRHERPSDRESSGFIGGGLFVSTDEGQTWNLVNGTLPAVATSGADWTEINEVVADPNDPAKIWIASNGPAGLYSYTPTNGLVAEGNFNTEIHDLKVADNGTETRIIVAAASTGMRTWVSDDSGVSFTDVSGNGVGQIPFGGVTRIEYAFATEDPNWVYGVTITGNAGSLLGVFLSRDGGMNWEPVSPSSNPSFDPFLHPSSGNAQGYYDCAITVVPGQKEKIIVGGITLWAYELGGNWEQIAIMGSFCAQCVHADIHEFHWDVNGTLYIGTDGGIYRTSDRQLYLPANRNYNVSQFYGIAQSTEGHVLGGTQDNGMILLNEQGNTFLEGVSMPLSVGADGVTAEISQEDADVMFGTGQFGFLERSEDGGITWAPFYSGTINSVGDPLASMGPFKTTIRLYENANDVNSEDFITVIADQDYNSGDTVYYSSLTGDRELAYEVQSPISEGDSIQLQDPVQSLFAIGFSGDDGVWVTRDAMRFGILNTEWWKVMDASGPSADFSNDQAHALEFSADGDHLFVGTSLGNVYRISGFNSAYSAEQATVGDPNCVLTVTKIYDASSFVTITGLSSDPQNAENLLISVGGYSNNQSVLFSSQAASAGGTGSFNSVDNGLPDIPVYSCLIDRDDEDVFIIGTEHGIYASDDAGASWTFDNNGMELVPVFDIRQQVKGWEQGAKNPGVIYIGTHGRGIWRSETLMSINDHFDEVANAPQIEGLEVYPNPAVNNTQVSFELPESSQVNMMVFDLNGRLVQELQLGQLPSGEQLINLSVTDLNQGIYLVNVQSETATSTAKLIVQK